MALPVSEDDALMPSLLTLSDVFSTGHHAAVSARVRKGSTVAVIGDGAVGLCGAPLGVQPFMANVAVTGGVAPARAYIEELMPDVLEGHVEPGRVFDRTVDLDGVPEGYAAMDARSALKVLVRP